MDNSNFLPTFAKISIVNSENKPFRKPFRPNFAPKPSNSEFVFGIQSVLETIRSGKEIDKILIQRELGNNEVLELAKESGLQVQKVPLEKLNRITRKNHQGVIAFVSAVHYAKLENVISDCYDKGENPFILVLHLIS